MKKLLVIFSALAFFSCKHENTIGRFTLTGEIKNASDQKIFLEEIYFSQNPPAVIDTSLLEKGKVNIKSIASEEGLYRIRSVSYTHLRAHETVLDLVCRLLLE